MKTNYYFLSDQLQQLLEKLQQDGYACVGPQVRDGAIIFDLITSVEQLPRGISDEQAPGSYSLRSNSTSKYFDWANGPQAINPYCLHREKISGKARKLLMDLSHLTPLNPTLDR